MLLSFFCSKKNIALHFSSRRLIKLNSKKMFVKSMQPIPLAVQERWRVQRSLIESRAKHETEQMWLQYRIASITSQPTALLGPLEIIDASSSSSEEDE